MLIEDEDEIDWGTIPPDSTIYKRNFIDGKWEHTIWDYSTTESVHVWFIPNEYGFFIYHLNGKYYLKKHAKSGTYVCRAKRVSRPFNDLKAARLAYTMMFSTFGEADEVE